MAYASLSIVAGTHERAPVAVADKYVIAIRARAAVLKKLGRKAPYADDAVGRSLFGLSAGSRADSERRSLRVVRVSSLLAEWLQSLLLRVATVCWRLATVRWMTCH